MASVLRRLGAQVPSCSKHQIKYRATLSFRRAFHEARADYVTTDGNGCLSKVEMKVYVGSAQESYVHFDRNVGFAMRSAIMQQTGTTPASDAEVLPLTFFHDSRHFAHSSLPYPRIVINQDLPRQNESSKSPATLWLWGASHCLTLDGTPDHHFTESARESSKRLGGVAELLKDR